jgi:hypothetical protein
MLNQLHCFAESVATVSDATPAASASEISAVALLKLLMRAETVSGTPVAAMKSAVIDCRPVNHMPINDRCEVKLDLSPFLQEQLKSITDAVFNRVNGDFYRVYKGLTPEQVGEIVLSKEDLRPLAYRALMHEGPAADRPFAPRFAASLLLLQKYWDCDFLQQYKDSRGFLSANSLKGAAGRF